MKLPQLLLNIELTGRVNYIKNLNLNSNPISNKNIAIAKSNKNQNATKNNVDF